MTTTVKKIVKTLVSVAERVIVTSHRSHHNPPSSIPERSPEGDQGWEKGQVTKQAKADPAPDRLVNNLMGAWGAYCSARVDLLSTLGIAQSCRDTLCDFAERLVACLLGGELASNRVQKDWDVNAPIGRVQVKYLAQPSLDRWVNWHTVKTSEGTDWYALVLYLGFAPAAVYVFPSGDLTPFCHALGKRHGDQGTTLQFTKGNHRDISSDPQKYEALGMMVFLVDVAGRWRRADGSICAC